MGPFYNEGFSVRQQLECLIWIHYFHVSSCCAFGCRVRGVAGAHDTLPPFPPAQPQTVPSASVSFWQLLKKVSFQIMLKWKITGFKQQDILVTVSLISVSKSALSVCPSRLPSSFWLTAQISSFLASPLILSWQTGCNSYRLQEFSIKEDSCALIGQLSTLVLNVYALGIHPTVPLFLFYKMMVYLGTQNRVQFYLISSRGTISTIS